MADIVELIRADHARIRQLFGKLDEVNPGEVWVSLADLLELHADVMEGGLLPAAVRGLSADRTGYR